MIYFSDFGTGGGGGPVEFVGSKAYSGTATTSFSITTTGLSGGSDTQARAGDLVVLVSSMAKNVNAATLASLSSDPGFVSRANIAGEDTYGIRQQVWTYATPSDAPTVTLTTNETGSRGVAILVFVFRKAAFGSVQTAQSQSTAHVDPPSITPTVAGSWIFVSGCSGSSSGAINYSTIPDLTDTRQQAYNGSGYDVSSAAGLKKDWTSGAFDPSAWTWGATNNTNWSMASVSMVIVPG